MRAPGPLPWARPEANRGNGRKRRRGGIRGREGGPTTILPIPRPPLRPSAPFAGASLRRRPALLPYFKVAHGLLDLPVGAMALQASLA